MGLIRKPSVKTAILKALRDPAILPFYALSIFYTVNQQPKNELSLSILFKAAPIWYLIFYLQFIKTRTTAYTNKLSHHGKSHKDDYSESGKNLYKFYFTIALAVSSVGDILLTVDAMFIPAMFVFGLTQFAYIFGLKRRRAKVAKLSRCVFLIGCITYLIVLPGLINHPLYLVLVFLYSSVIHTMLFNAASSVENTMNAATLFSAMGALFFVLSDFLIALKIWVTILPHHPAAIMLTYYTAQLCLTLSVLR